jgi:hypothetical protein
MNFCCQCVIKVGALYPVPALIGAMIKVSGNRQVSCCKAAKRQNAFLVKAV